MNAFTKFYFRPGEGELIETTLRASPDQRSAIYGTVLDSGDRPVPDALVLLFDGSEEEPRLLNQLFTNERGQFAFGPLTPARLHFIRVYKNDVKLRELEIRTDS